MPSIQRLLRSEPLSSFVEALERDGCVIVKDFTDAQTVEQANEEVKPWLEKQGQAGAKVGGECSSINHCGLANNTGRFLTEHRADLQHLAEAHEP